MGLDRLPLANGEKHIKAFERGGWTVAPGRSSSHVVLRKPGAFYNLSIPTGRKDVKRAPLAAQLKRAGLTEDEYLDLFAGRKREG